MPLDEDDINASYPYPQQKHPLAEPMYWDPSETSLTALPRLPEPIATQYKEIVLGGHGFGNRPNSSVDAIAQHYDRSSPSDDEDEDFQIPSSPPPRTTEVKGLRDNDRQRRRREMTLRVTTSGWEEALHHPHPGDHQTSAASRYSCCDDDGDQSRGVKHSSGKQRAPNFWSWDLAQPSSPEFMARVSSPAGRREFSIVEDSESEYEYEAAMGKF